MSCLVPNHFFGTCLHNGCDRLLIVQRNGGMCQFYPLNALGDDGIQEKPLTSCPLCGKPLCVGLHGPCDLLIRGVVSY